MKIQINDPYNHPQSTLHGPQQMFDNFFKVAGKKSVKVSFEIDRIVDITYPIHNSSDIIYEKSHRTCAILHPTRFVLYEVLLVDNKPENFSSKTITFPLVKALELILNTFSTHGFCSVHLHQQSIFLHSQFFQFVTNLSSCIYLLHYSNSNLLCSNVCSS